jgi:hypothetical protein
MSFLLRFRWILRRFRSFFFSSYFSFVGFDRRTNRRVLIVGRTFNSFSVFFSFFSFRFFGFVFHHYLVDFFKKKKKLTSMGSLCSRSERRLFFMSVDRAKESAAIAAVNDQIDQVKAKKNRQKTTVRRSFRTFVLSALDQVQQSFRPLNESVGNRKTNVEEKTIDVVCLLAELVKENHWNVVCVPTSSQVDRFCLFFVCFSIYFVSLGTRFDSFQWFEIGQFDRISRSSLK